MEKRPPGKSTSASVRRRMKDKDPENHRQYRALLKKQKRQAKRQAAAQQRDAILKEQGVLSDSEGAEEDTTGETLENNMEDNVEEMTEEQKKAHEEWQEREKEAQEDFRKRKAKEEAEKQKKLQEQRRIKEEWNKQQQKEQEEKDKKDKELENVLQQLDKENKLQKDAWPWHNPEPTRQSATTETNKESCSFFLKTGACRFGERCSRAHQHPAISTTLLFPGMYSSYAIEQSFRDEYDSDIGLEYDESDAYKNFVEFYEDVLPEFKALGKVVQFKVCCNWEPHLRGNVYVQFATEEDASKAYTSFNGRWYAGKQLVCQYSPVSKWRGAICGTFHYNKCPRGKNCNFLHVFINPNKEFADADRDFNKDQRGHRSDNHWTRRGRYSYRGRSRDRGRSRSRSRDRRHRSRRRSRSRDRRRSYSRSRSRSRDRDRRDRSHDRDRRYHRSRSRSRDRRSRSHSRNRSRERSRRRDRQESRSRSRSRSKSKGRNKKKKKRKHRNHSKERKQKHSKRKASESSDSSDSSSESESDISLSGESGKVTNGSCDSKPASEEAGVYPNLANLIARDYGLLPPGSDASSEPATPSVGQRSSEPPTPSAGQRSSEPPTPIAVQRLTEDQEMEEEVDGEDALEPRSKESHSQKKQRHKHKHKSRHKHMKQSAEVSPGNDNAS